MADQHQYFSQDYIHPDDHNSSTYINVLYYTSTYLIVSFNSCLAVARNLLYTCKGNLEVAINIHLNMEDTIPDVIPCPDSAQSTSTTGEGSEEIASVQQPVAINESILSLLLKIKTNLQSSSSSKYGL